MTSKTQPLTILPTSVGTTVDADGATLELGVLVIPGRLWELDELIAGRAVTSKADMMIGDATHAGWTAFDMPSSDYDHDVEILPFYRKVSA